MTEVKNNICINVFRYEDWVAFTIYVSDETFEDSINFLLLIEDDSQYRH